MLSIIIPVYNEVQTIEKIVLKIKKIKDIKKQIIIVDDGSTDGTSEKLKVIKSKFKIDKIIFNKKKRLFSRFFLLLRVLFRNFHNEIGVYFVNSVENFNF